MGIPHMTPLATAAAGAGITSVPSLRHEDISEYSHFTSDITYQKDFA